VFEPLLELDNRVQFQPRLARSIRLLDDLTWEVKLNTAARFHDGTPFEADDIAFTFARIPTVPNSPALFSPAVRTIAAVEVVDPETVLLRTREPNPMLRFDMSGPVILSRKIHGPNPQTADFNSGRLMIGTGPYRHVDYRHSERLELARNTAWYGPAEPWDRVVYRFIPQAGSRTAALLERRTGPRRLQPAALCQSGGGRPAPAGDDHDRRGSAARADPGGGAGAAGRQGPDPGDQPEERLGRAARQGGLRPEPAEHDRAAAGPPAGLGAG
jgi:MarR-like DNA-binding transcriptional regulator SgrR of sgrS sRNA